MSVLFKEGDEPTDTEVRDYVESSCDAIVLRTIAASGHNVKTLHLPQPDNNEMPMCLACRGTSEWTQKPLAVYPEGHMGWCRRCLARAFPRRANITFEVDQ